MNTTCLLSQISSFLYLSLFYFLLIFSLLTLLFVLLMIVPRPLPVLVTGDLVITKLEVRLTCNFQVGDSNLVQGELINDML